MKLDLHGVKHADVYPTVDKFIWNSMLNRVHQVEIVTGKSSDMIKIVTSCLSDYNMEPRINEIVGVMYVDIDPLF